MRHDQADLKTLSLITFFGPGIPHRVGLSGPTPPLAQGYPRSPCGWRQAWPRVVLLSRCRPDLCHLLAVFGYGSSLFWLCPHLALSLPLLLACLLSVWALSTAGDPRTLRTNRNAKALQSVFLSLAHLFFPGHEGSVKPPGPVGPPIVIGAFGGCEKRCSTLSVLGFAEQQQLRNHMRKFPPLTPLICRDTTTL